ncbi:Uncharacterised protein [Mycobacteroides abscessus subsp. abscessus]|nr:Uncharacterised protein [Mycobacteroides abscessus subsp. abscessus]
MSSSIWAATAAPTRSGSSFARTATWLRAIMMPLAISPRPAGGVRCLR